MIFVVTASSRVPYPFDQSNALLQFKNSVSISMPEPTDYLERYPKTNSWKEGTDCCLWDGVSCELATGYVIELDLSSSPLCGNLYPNSSLFALHHLQVLDLSNNNFKGSKIPSQFGHLLSLTHLSLGFSNFTGQVPLEISQVINLVSLDLIRETDGDPLEMTAAGLNNLVQN
ncbi:hypothetical protein JCGZ_09597 [Jatropha curcas]|uniref:Leucine-rich repeat-containing N-terminal plant-type domain-containing protein n=1 Tax=Jatropha curcas TaxID=180498 RepID=A0A067LDP7_JATCU|nr:receptor-like protein 9DC1 [Jatropha curcas]KDP45348.1 hypothetical protein JCGZ_09597 [Jatropha curcas]